MTDISSRPLDWPGRHGRHRADIGQDRSLRPSPVSPRIAAYLLRSPGESVYESAERAAMIRRMPSWLNWT